MSTQNKTDPVLIVGAGMAGLTAAKFLTNMGREVLVLEKGRGVGGRMATRRFGNGRFDHGAQYFTARGEWFRRTVIEWQKAGIISAWSDGFPVYPNQSSTSTYPRYRGQDGMTAVPKHLARDLDVQLNVRITAVHQEKGGWLLNTQSGTQFRGQALLLTPPVPQSLALLEAGKVALPEKIRQGLEAVAYHPCLALMTLFAEPTQIPEPGGLRFTKGAITWIADNHRKGISPNGYGVTIHASPDFSREHWQSEADVVAEKLLDAASYWLPLDLLAWQLHRWRYSQVKTMHPEPMLCLPDKPALVLAGDAFGGARVEGAAVSGYAAAQALLPITT